MTQVAITHEAHLGAAPTPPPAELADWLAAVAQRHANPNPRS